MPEAGVDRARRGIQLERRAEHVHRALPAGEYLAAGQAEGGILGVHSFHGIRVIPDAKRVLLKVLTLLICFNDAIQRARTNHPTNQEFTAGDN